MGGIPPISPATILDLRERLDWPCDPVEAVTVLIDLDDTWREMQQKD